MYRFLLFLLLQFAFVSTIFSQSYGFNRIDNTNGLSNNQVSAIFKDSNGFMWFATNSGLNRYDGHQFKIFKNDKKNPLTIGSDKISSIGEDAKGYLWLQINDSIYDIYDPFTEKFYHDSAPFLKNFGLSAHPSRIVISPQKDFYAYYRNTGIYWYDHKNREVTRFPQSANKPNAISKGAIMNFAVSDQYIWIIFNNLLIERINKKTGKSDYQNTYFLTSRIKSTLTKNILIDDDGDIWIYPSLDDKGVAYLDVKTKKWNFLEGESTAPVSQNLVRFIVQDKNHNFWICTDHGGVHVFNKQTHKSTVLVTDIFNENSISQNSAICGYYDNNGIVWIGTYKNGICYYHPDLFKFRKPPFMSLYREESEPFDCNSLFKDKTGNLWIGTNGTGLVCYNEKQNRLKIFRTRPNDATSISSDIITSITEDHASTLWIGTFLGGLNAYKDGHFRHYQFDEKNSNSLAGKSVYGVVEDNEQNLWIGTLGGGLDLLSPDRNQFTRFTTNNSKHLASNFILSLSISKDKDILISTDRGLSWATPNLNGHLVLHKNFPLDKLPNAKINYSIKDSRGMIWMATDKGIVIYWPKNGEFKYLDMDTGLPDDEVVSLVEDNQGRIWSGTRKGLVRIIYHKDKTFSIAIFDTKDGLPSSVCNQNAIFKDVEGKIYVGTIKGYTGFDPDKITTNEIVPQPSFTELLISNKVIQPGVKYNGRIIIEKSITTLKELKLNYDETNFSISFSALNYLHPDKNIYRYKLEGLDNDWNISRQGEGIVSYSNLSQGTYRLIVYASNNDGIWSKTPLILKITVRPPFWSTWWAYLLYLLIASIILWKFIQTKLKKEKEAFLKEQTVINAKKMHEVDELKFKFFTNISHEFKTPITLIVAPVDKLLQDEDKEENKELLGIIKRNALTLLNMVNEILEFRKLDVNKLSLKLTKGDIIDFVRQNCYSFSTLAKQKAIDFTFSSSIEKLMMDFDREKMARIITNLLSNAFKYTEYGEISLKINTTENLNSNKKTLQITVSDTGIGIAPDKIDKIFERFYRIETDTKDNNTGAGVGLHLVSEYIKLHHGDIHVKSEPNKGSEFCVSIPIEGAVNYTETISQESPKPHEGLEVMISSNKKEHHSFAKIGQPLLLIVDDNEDFRNFLASLFSDSYHLAFAQDGLEASAAMIDQLPDVVLCDVMMPRMNGYEFCKKMKEDKRTTNIPIILITAKTSDENKFQGVEAGADDYISKPFNIDLLVLKVSKLVENHKKFLDSQKNKIDLSPSEIEIIPESEKFVKRAIAIVEENIGNPDFLVENLCKQMAMSRVGFYKQILSITGKTPSEFIRHIRLQRAANLLEKSELYINEIAFQVGFNDPKYFRKYFKDEYGITPNEYKKQHEK